jgi:hypothetical protein
VYHPFDRGVDADESKWDICRIRAHLDELKLNKNRPPGDLKIRRIWEGEKRSGRVWRREMISVFDGVLMLNEGVL